MSEPLWLSRIALEAIHEGQIREHGGSHGVRDEGLLESVLGRPRHRHIYEPDADLASLAAAYGFGICKNHPFVDGNKRTALMAMYAFLEVNGFELDAPEPEAVQVMLGVADGSVDEDALAGWIRRRLRPWEGEDDDG